MALIKCVDCGKDISDKASRCPKCGCPIEYMIKNDVSVEEVKEVKEETKKDTEVKVEVKKKSKKGLIAVICSLLVIVIVLFITICLLPSSIPVLGDIHCYLFGCVTPVEDKIHSGEYIHVVNEYINVRDDYAVNANLLGKVEKDEYYEVLEYHEGASYYWVRILYDGTNSGWVASPKNGTDYYEVVSKDQVPKK